ncbi:hypothetical protein Poli38472_014718 [Pythium oligandrum]|uniref:Elicitin n=1 Tax=Pythium oligandrum TaxID=41045 RepID=A0A8K1FCX4_PYTOL|nr:hypothetical protein Poli38472_014718 [Pythium oligandrum]|eukprot:TMW54947.1 hypothetical protein Poli38472_014718 [Pythium oligandrum]
MKAALLVSLAVASVSAEVCDLAKLSIEVGTIVKPAFSCKDASGYDFITPTRLPTDADVKAVCSSPVCQELITAAKGVALPSCELKVGTTGTIPINELFAKIMGNCANIPVSSSTGSASGAGAATDVVVPPTSSTETASGSEEAGSAVSTPAPSSAMTATLGAAVAVACSVAALML